MLVYHCAYTLPSIRAQMVSLYNNPTGEGIFTGHDNAPAVSYFASQLGVGQGDTVEELKKKVKELEGIIGKLKVRVVVLNLVSSQ